MRIRILSDIHVDSHRGERALPACWDCDIDIVAGDWANGGHLLREGFTGYTPTMPILMVLGNHEWYGLNMETHREAIKGVAAQQGITLLDRDVYEKDGWTILGCTLWTNFELYGRWEWHAEQAMDAISDFRWIKVGTSRLLPYHVRGLYAGDVAWLDQQLSAHDPARTIVVTHFGPHRESCHPLYSAPGSREFNPYFISDCGLIEKHEPRLWIHGHTHMPLDYKLGHTRVICNPRGYAGERQPGSKTFDPQLVVDLND